MYLESFLSGPVPSVAAVPQANVPISPITENYPGGPPVDTGLFAKQVSQFAKIMPPRATAPAAITAPAAEAETAAPAPAAAEAAVAPIGTEAKKTLAIAGSALAAYLLYSWYISRR